MKRLITFPLYALVLLAGLSVLLLGSNLHTWNRLTSESPIAELTFRKTGPREYAATIAYGDFCTAQTYRLVGEHWRLDAQFLKWRPWANLFGFDSMYRIERLGGRYLEVADENTGAHEAHALHSTDLPDLTEILGRYKGRLSPVDTFYGSSVYEAMDELHIFRVYRSQSGLLVRKQPLAGNGAAGSGFTIPIDTSCPDD